MAEIQSTDYHDFVFQEGKLVGEFEQMYRKSAQVPWHQDRDPDRADCRIAIELLRIGAPYGTTLELCSGLGYFAQFVQERVPMKSITGSDISVTAVERSRLLFPSLSFETLDLCQELAEQGWLGKSFDLVIIRASFWYLFPNMKRVVANLHTLVKSGGYLFVSQNFPPLDRDFVGKEVIPSPDSLMSHFRGQFTFRAINQFDDRTTDGGNDNWLMFLAQKHAD